MALVDDDLFSDKDVPVLMADDATLRDYFAAKVCANIDEYVAGVYYQLGQGHVEGAHEQAALIARTAYVLADAMLNERSK